MRLRRNEESTPGPIGRSGDGGQLDDEHHPGDEQHQQEGEERKDGGRSHGRADPSLRREMAARHITFVTRRGCTLCDEAWPGVEDWAGRLGLEIRVIDVDDAGLTGPYGDRVPVVLSGEDEELLWGRWGSLRLARAMLRARYG